MIRGVTHKSPCSGMFSLSHHSTLVPSPPATYRRPILATVCHYKEAERSRVRLNEKKLKADRTPASRKLVVEMKGEKVAVTVVKKAGSYTVTWPAGNVELVDNFSFADCVIDTQLNGESLVAQLIMRDPSGQLRIN